MGVERWAFSVGRSLFRESGVGGRASEICLCQGSKDLADRGTDWPRRRRRGAVRCGCMNDRAETPPGCLSLTYSRAT